jgi:hypothetical protein
MELKFGKIKLLYFMEIEQFETQELNILEKEEIVGGTPAWLVLAGGFGAAVAAGLALAEAYEWGYNLADRAFKRNTGWK